MLIKNDYDKVETFFGDFNPLLDEVFKNQINFE